MFYAQYNSKKFVIAETGSVSPKNNVPYNNINKVHTKLTRL